MIKIQTKTDETNKSQASACAITCQFICLNVLVCIYSPFRDDVLEICRNQVW